MSQPIRNAALAGLQSAQISKKAAPQKTAGFDSLLADRLKVSGHAQTRLESRDIALDKAQWDRVLSGVDKAAEKGAQSSLVMLDDVALIVSVKNRTVITAMDQAQMQENVFTNIDSAVIV